MIPIPKLNTAATMMSPRKRKAQTSVKTTDVANKLENSPLALALLISGAYMIPMIIGTRTNGQKKRERKQKLIFETRKQWTWLSLMSPTGITAIGAIIIGWAMGTA